MKNVLLFSSYVTNVDTVHTVCRERCLLVVRSSGLLLPSTARTKMDKCYTVSFQAAEK